MWASASVKWPLILCLPKWSELWTAIVEQSLSIVVAYLPAATEGRRAQSSDRMLRSTRNWPWYAIRRKSKLIDLQRQTRTANFCNFQILETMRQHLPNNMPAKPVSESRTMTVKLSPLFSVPNTTPMKKITSVHCKNTITDCVRMWAMSSSGVVMPATSVRSQTPSMRSVMNTAAVTNVAKKKTILWELKKMRIGSNGFSDWPALTSW